VAKSPRLTAVNQKICFAFTSFDEDGDWDDEEGDDNDYLLQIFLEYHISD